MPFSRHSAKKSLDNREAFLRAVRRSASGACPHWAIRGGRFALHSNRTFITRGLYFFDRCSFDSDVLQVYPMCNYNIRFVEAFRFCLAAERIIRGGTRQGDALFPRASPLQKQSTGLFLNSPLAEGLLTLEVSRSAERDQRLCLWTLPPLKRRAKLLCFLKLTPLPLRGLGRGCPVDTAAQQQRRPSR